MNAKMLWIVIAILAIFLIVQQCEISSKNSSISEQEQKIECCVKCLKNK